MSRQQPPIIYATVARSRISELQAVACDTAAAGLHSLLNDINGHVSKFRQQIHYTPVQLGSISAEKALAVALDAQKATSDGIESLVTNAATLRNSICPACFTKQSDHCEDCGMCFGVGSHHCEAR